MTCATLRPRCCCVVHRVASLWRRQLVTLVWMLAFVRKEEMNLCYEAVCACYGIIELGGFGQTKGVSSPLKRGHVFVIITLSVTACREAAV